MMRRGMMSGLVAVSVLLGCRPANPTLDSSPGLLPVVLPDLSGMHEVVQEQFREAHALLESVREAGPPVRGEAYGEMGNLFWVGGYVDLAERCYRNAQLLAPDDFRWPYSLGHLFMKKKGDLREAAEHFERALRVRPTDFTALIWLVDVYIDLGQPEAAEPILTKARSLYPGTPAVLFELGKAALATQDYASAVEHLEGALRLNPEATALHYRLAMAYRGLGDLENAQYHLGRHSPGETITLLDPLIAEVNTMLRSPAHVPLGLGLEATANEDWSEAATQFRKAVEIEPDNPRIRLNLGRALNLIGEARAALDEFEEAVRLAPQFASAHYNMGTILERSGRDQEAIDHYTLAVTHDPNLGEAHLGLANALHRTGRFEASLSHYQLVIERPEARFGEAIALVRFGRHREARERLRVAMDLHPDQPLFANALARLLATSPDDQVRDGRRAFELVDALVKEQQTTAVAETMAMALAELGQFTGAAEWQRAAMSVAAEAGRPDMAEQMSANLALYERREPCRTPWRDDDPDYWAGPVVEPGLLDL